jgi:crotonobetaine/carnitine-CoA ligase
MIDHFPSRDECVIADLLDRWADERPGATYAHFAEEKWTFAGTADKAWQFGNALLDAGVEEGESVSVWMPTRPELVQSWFGANAIGAVFAPLAVAARGTFLEHCLNLAAPRLLVAHGGLIERLVGLAVPSLERIVVIGEAPDVDLPWPLESFGDFVASAATNRPQLAVPIEPWDDFALIYTSGTTGPSKGVRLSYASHRSYADALVLDEIGREDRFLMSLPLSHVAGTSTTYAMLQRGGTIVLPGAFDPKTFWKEVRRYEITSTFIIHGMVSFLLGQPALPEDADSSLRYVYMGPLTRVEEFCERFGVSIYTGFGMTEVPLCLRSGINPTAETTVGRPFNPDCELRLVDDHDLSVPDGTPGELIVRHQHPWMLNSGYRDMPEATARAWRNGWFHTGDQMLVDENGDWVFVDRVKDAIRRRGENISSYEVEAEVLSHAAVDQVAAVAVPAPGAAETSGDEEVKVVVVAAEGREVDPQELIEYLIPRMPRHMVPRFVEVVEELPRTPSFKIKKSDLREAGVTASTWDREATGIKLKREQLA